MAEGLLKPSGRDVSRIRDKASTILLWQACRKAVSETMDNTPETTGIDLALSNDKRSELLAGFRVRYNVGLPIEYQPSDATLEISMRTHARKSAEFIPLSKVNNLIDGRDFHSEPVRLSKNLTIDLAGPNKRTASDFNTSAEPFLHAVRVIMNGYALVSANDTVPWCSLEADRKRLTIGGNISRASSKSQHTAHNKILDTEMQVRCEWARISQSDTRYSLSDVIEIVAHRHSIWPITADLRGTRDGEGRVNRTVNPYSNDWPSASSSYGKSYWSKGGKGDAKGDGKGELAIIVSGVRGPGKLTTDLGRISGG